MENLFDLFFGLPLHPLIDHVVVIILPLSALGAILLTFFAKYRKNYGFLVLLGMFVSAISAFIAKQSGEALAARVGWPGNHAELGTNLVIVSFVLFVVYLVWFILQKVDKSKVSNLQFLIKITSGLLVISSVTALVLTVLVGHSGASASWEKRINPPTSTTSQTSISENNSPTQQEAMTLSAQTVAIHNSVNDCWTIIDGNVYDLTSYINSHPGGVNNISSICGIDGSKAFTNQHGKQGAPNNELSNLLIGAINSQATSTTSSNITTNNSAQNQTSPSPKNISPITLSATEVANHNSEKDCWSIVKGNVYDLTSYIRSHPGGPNRIISICGKDGTQAFSNQHGNQGSPNRTLDSFLIGAIDQTVTSLPSPVSLPVIVGGSGENEGWENEENENE